MARYAPLPIVSIDPRNEAELVQAASQRVYDASNQTLNDFSSGNPLAALVEGQAFAQGEFLFWANQLPQSILIDWIGPFLGAQRRIGSPATAQLFVTITPTDSTVTILSGTSFTTAPNLADGQSYSYITIDDVNIPGGEETVSFPVYSQYVGTQYNVPANSIVVSPATGINFLNVTNPLPAVGGSDAETWQEVQERFFPIIRRKNPVSAQDWEDLFVDLFGTGTLTSVQPNRPSERAYNYLTDYLLPNGQVSFFVLGPGGIELTTEQLRQGQNVVNFSVPVENQGHLYPITLSQVQFDLTVEVDANGAYGGNGRTSSLNFRNRLNDILIPGNVFPTTINPTVSDVDSAFYSTFTSTERYINPKIVASKAYNTPQSFDVSAATYTQVYAFQPTGNLYNTNDLVFTTNPITVYYPVVSGFTPYSADKRKQTVYGNLLLRQIQLLTAATYLQGDIVYWASGTNADGELHVINQNLTVVSQDDVERLISEGQISAAKTYSTWTVGNSYTNTVNGLFNPDIVEYDYLPNEFIPDPTSSIPLSKRPGAFAWLVGNNFTLQTSTDDLTGAATAGVLGSALSSNQIQELIPGNVYPAGIWVYTPQVGSGPNPVADPYFNYVDRAQGVVNKYAYVIETFTYTLSETQTVSQFFDTAVAQNIIQEVVASNANDGLPIYKYKPRFQMGTYLEYRATASENPSYYIAAEYFTPNSTAIGDLLNERLVYPLATTPAQNAQLATYFQDNTSIIPSRMFTFFAGDRTYFREGSTILQYTATSSVTPLFDFSIYLENGVFVLSEEYPTVYFETTSYIPFFNTFYNNYAEDTIVSEDGRNFYRVMKAFTPPATVVNWTNTTVVNTARIEEYAGNLLRYVSFYTCEQEILPQLGTLISALKLGIAQITLIPRNKGRFSDTNQESVFVWENTSSYTATPQLSWFSGTTYQYNPPNYREGTLRL